MDGLERAKLATSPIGRFLIESEAQPSFTQKRGAAVLVFCTLFRSVFFYLWLLLCTREPSNQRNWREEEARREEEEHEGRNGERGVIYIIYKIAWSYFFCCVVFRKKKEKAIGRWADIQPSSGREREGGGGEEGEGGRGTTLHCSDLEVTGLLVMVR